MSKPISKKWVDTLVIGAGFAGILAAAIEAKKGKQVLVVDSARSIGGRWSPETRNGYQFGICLACSDARTWDSIYSSLHIPYEKIMLENGGALVHTNKGWEQPEVLGDELSYWENYFTQSIPFVPKGGLHGFLQTIRNENLFEVALESPLTELHIEGAKAIRALAGEWDLEFSECIWAADAKILMDVLRGTDVPEPGTARIAWMKQFILHAPSPGVVLEFAHDHALSEFTETLVLPLPTPDEEKQQRYLVGAFLSNRDQSLAPNAKQLSSWIFSLPEEMYEDNHEIMKRIRAARRAIEKCFAGFEKSIAFERVQVLPNTVSPLKVKKAKPKAAPIFSNLVTVADWAAPKGAHFSGIADHILGQHN